MNIEKHNRKHGSGPGRPKGSRNKITKDIKIAILNAFNEVGGQDYLVKVAQEDPKTFCALIGKIIPHEITGDADNPLSVVTKVILTSDNDGG